MSSDAGMKQQETDMSMCQQTIEAIRPLNEQAMRQARQQLDQLTKPPGSLGKLEHTAERLAGITGMVVPDLRHKAVVVWAADHGVCEEGVSAFPSEVTPQMVRLFLRGDAAVNVLARHANVRVLCVDIGIAQPVDDLHPVGMKDPSLEGAAVHPHLLARRIRRGTANMARGPAMSRGEALRGLATGIELAQRLAREGVALLATGEMGIGNTTASAALFHVLAGVPLAEAVGRGTGIDDDRLRHKCAVVERAVAVNTPDARDPIDVLAKVGGLEIAGLAGMILGAASERVPVVVDGFISTVAALVAVRLAPLAGGYLLPSHVSHEQGHARLLQELGLSPLLQLDMRLGEGTGAVLAMPIIEAATKLLQEMATFASAGIAPGPTK